ncbi:MAG: HlyD family efflux transporter periplasmic adaptor subunit [Bacillota bacterium]|nr:HlyD family efflux transporter periplasmic adaptor subunit [Bacillota bacterium]
MAEKKKRRKRLKWALIAAGAAIVAVLLVVILVMPNEAANLSSLFTKATVEKGTVEVSVVADGYISPETATVNASFNGYATDLLKAGSAVKEGDVLCTLVPDAETLKNAEIEYQAALIQLERLREVRPMPSIVTAPDDGRVFLLKAGKGDDADAVCQQYGQLMVVSTGGVKVALPDGAAAAGDRLTLSYKGHSYSAEAVLIDGKLYALCSSNAPIPGKDAKILKTGVQIASGTIEMEKFEPIAGAGTVEDVYVSENETVDRGDRLIQLMGCERMRGIITQEGKTELLKKQLDDMSGDGRLLAPLDGWISQVNAKEGVLVNKMQALFTLQSATLAAEVSVDEIDVVKLKKGAAVELQLDALPDKTASGTVEFISGSGTITGDTVNYLVYISIAGTEGLLPGMSCQATVLVDRKVNVLRVPTDAVLDGPDGTKIVMVATGDTSKIADYAARDNVSLSDMMKNASAFGGKGSALQSGPRTVKVGLANEYWTEITEGLTEGEVVLIPSSQSSGFASMMRSGFGQGRVQAQPQAPAGGTEK